MTSQAITDRLANFARTVPVEGPGGLMRFQAVPR